MTKVFSHQRPTVRMFSFQLDHTTFRVPSGLSYVLLESRNTSAMLECNTEKYFQRTMLYLGSNDTKDTGKLDTVLSTNRTNVQQYAGTKEKYIRIYIIPLFLHFPSSSVLLRVKIQTNEHVD